MGGHRIMLASTLGAPPRIPGMYELENRDNVIECGCLMDTWPFCWPRNTVVIQVSSMTRFALILALNHTTGSTSSLQHVLFPLLSHPITLHTRSIALTVFL